MAAGHGDKSSNPDLKALAASTQSVASLGGPQQQPAQVFVQVYGKETLDARRGLSWWSTVFEMLLHIHGGTLMPYAMT